MQHLSRQKIRDALHKKSFFLSQHQDLVRDISFYHQYIGLASRRMKIRIKIYCRIPQRNIF